MDEISPEPTDRPTVALALGSGGARGFAHIGVVQVLAEAGVEVVAVSGCSMGAIVGGFLAAGELDEFTDWATGLGRLEMLRMVDVALRGSGAVRGDRFFAVVGELLGGVRIEDLDTEFTAVATDLISRREVWFRRGPLDVALRASSAIPSFFVPVELDGRLLVDGAVLDPVPVAPVAAAHADLVIAVSLDGFSSTAREHLGRSPTEPVERPRSGTARWFDRELFGTVRQRIAAATSRSSGADGSPADSTELRSVDVARVAYEITQAALTRHHLAGFTPDAVVSIPRSACRTFEFDRAAEMVELGRRLASEQLGDLLDTV